MMSGHETIGNTVRDTEELADAAAVRSATGDDPFARGSAGWRQLRGWRRPGVAAWCGYRPGHPDPGLAAVGEPGAVAALVDDLADRSLLPAGRLRAVLPYGSAGEFGRVAVDGNRPPADWDHLWTRAAPAEQPAEHRVRWLRSADAGAIDALLDEGNPDSHARPDSAHVRRWAGAFDEDGRLVACGADTAVDAATGNLSAITTHPLARGRGLGAAVTAFLTRAAFAEGADVVTLGLWSWNDPARRIYQRLGFGHPRRFTTQWLLPDLSTGRSPAGQCAERGPVRLSRAEQRDRVR